MRDIHNETLYVKGTNNSLNVGESVKHPSGGHATINKLRPAINLVILDDGSTWFAESLGCEFRSE